MSDEGDAIEPPTKKVKQEDDKDTDEGAPEEIKRNEAGDQYFDLSSKRRLTIRKWKGNTLLDIREVRALLIIRSTACSSIMIFFMV